MFKVGDRVRRVTSGLTYTGIIVLKEKNALNINKYDVKWDDIDGIFTNYIDTEIVFDTLYPMEYYLYKK